MKTYALTPQDAWFFRDGRPYNLGEANQAAVPSAFPPPARTLTGALRAALARVNGWSGRGRWKTELNQALGSGPDELGELQFMGPFLIKDKAALWPLPRHLLGRVQERWQPVAFLSPDEGAAPYPTDKGDVRLPRVCLRPGETGNGLKLAEGAWLSVSALKDVLEGKLPKANDIYEPKQLWASEFRVGLHRDKTTLTTGEGALYSPSYIRLRRQVALGVSLARYPNGIQAQVPALFPLGGESRLAQCEPWGGDPLPAALSVDSFRQDKEGNIRFTVILLTPGSFRELPLPKAEVVSACLGKPQLIGGWNSLEHKPLALRPFLPAGSVWFCKAAAADFPAILDRHGTWLGEDPVKAHGFGQIVIGHWPQLTC